MPDQPEPAVTPKRPPVWDVLVLALFLGVGIFGAFETAGSDGFACWLIGVLDVLIVREAWMRFRDRAATR